MPRPPKAKSAVEGFSSHLGLGVKLWLGFQPPDIARRFDELTAPLMAKIKANFTQSHILATQRDTLLPKLLSGELSVTEIGKEVPA